MASRRRTKRDPSFLDSLLKAAVETHIEYERESWRRQRMVEAELARQASANAREATKAAMYEQRRAEAMLIVEQSELRVAQLETVHQQASPPVDWSQFLNPKLPPVPLAPSDPRLLDLENQLANFKPTFIESLFGGRGLRRRSQLEEEVLRLRQHRQEQHDAAVELHRQEVAAARELEQLAEKLLRGDLSAREEVFELIGCFEELVELGAEPETEVLGDGTLYLHLFADEASVVPREVKVYSESSNKAISQKLDVARRMEIHQDYVCGLALRGAREIYSALPGVRSVLVDVVSHVVDPRSGSAEGVVLLSVYCPQLKIAGVDWETADASDVVEELSHRMKFLSRKGLQPVVSFVDAPMDESAD